MNMSKVVQVQMVPGTKKTVNLDDDASVADAIAAAELTTEGYQISVSDNPSANTATKVNNGALIMLTRAVKGA